MNTDAVQNVAGIAGALAVLASMLGRLFPWRIRVGQMMAVLWVALLLFLVGYATRRGESALSDLDEIRLITDF
jgi:hypothetical protein